MSPARSTATSATAPDPQLPGTAWPSYRLPHPVLALNRSTGRPGTLSAPCWPRDLIRACPHPERPIPVVSVSQQIHDLPNFQMSEKNALTEHKSIRSQPIPDARDATADIGAADHN